MSDHSLLVDRLEPEWCPRFTVRFADRRPPQSYSTPEQAEACVTYWAAQGDAATIKDESAMIGVKVGERLI